MKKYMTHHEPVPYIAPQRSTKAKDVVPLTTNGKKTAYRAKNRVTNSIPATNPQIYLIAETKLVSIAIKAIFFTEYNFLVLFNVFSIIPLNNVKALN